MGQHDTLVTPTRLDYRRRVLAAHPPEPILVTGATGNVGGALVRLLAAAGIPTRALVRDPAAHSGPRDANLAWARLDFLDRATWPAALASGRRLFLVRPPQLADVDAIFAPFIAAAAEAGVTHVVFLSLQGVERAAFLPHAKIERAIRGSGLAWTFLRAGFFMQNLGTTHRAEIATEDCLVVPAGRGRTSFVDVRDVAEVALHALTDPGHEGRAYTLTGAAALSYGEVVAAMSEVLGRPIRYVSPGPLRWLARARAAGQPWGFAVVTLALYTVARFGRAAGVSDDLGRLLGRPPRTLRRYLEDHRHLWQPPR